MSRKRLKIIEQRAGIRQDGDKTQPHRTKKRAGINTSQGMIWLFLGCLIFFDWTSLSVEYSSRRAYALLIALLFTYAASRLVDLFVETRQ